MDIFDSNGGHIWRENNTGPLTGREPIGIIAGIEMLGPMGCRTVRLTMDPLASINPCINNPCGLYIASSPWPWDTL
jgi:hypothetical protein